MLCTWPTVTEGTSALQRTTSRMLARSLKLLEGKDPIVPFIPSSLTTVPSTGCSTEQVPPKSSVTGAAFIPQ